MSRTDPIKDPNDIGHLKNYFLQKGKYRDYVMTTFILNTSIKLETMLRIKWKDVVDYKTGSVLEEVTLADSRTDNTVLHKVYLNSEVRKAFEIYMESLEHHIPPDSYVFKSRVGENRPLDRITVYKMIKRAAAEIGIEGNISLQSLKKTLGYQAWQQGYSRDVIMDLYHHPSIAYTKRFLSISEEDGENKETRRLMEKVKL